MGRQSSWDLSEDKRLGSDTDRSESKSFLSFMKKLVWNKFVVPISRFVYNYIYYAYDKNQNVLEQ